MSTVLWVDIAYLLFAAISLYMFFMFFLLYVRNRTQLRTAPVMTVLPTVSIIVPAYNEEKTIAGTLEAIKRLQYPPDKLEILVVDDGSTDGTAAVVKGFQGVKLIQKQNGGKASALNAGLKEVKGELVACIDSDSRPAPDSLIKAVPFFSEPNVAAVTTSIFVREPRNIVQRLQRIEYIMIVWARKLLEFLDSIYVTPGPLSIYRTRVLRELGGFDENNITEDIEIAWRIMHAGWTIKMATCAEVETTAPATFRNWWRQRMRWNIGGIQTTLKYKHTMFKQGFGALGNFVLPFFSASYILSMLGLFVFGYMLIKSIWTFVQFSWFAVAAGANPMYFSDFMLLPDIFTIFGIIIFILSIIWVCVSLREVKKPIGGLKGIPDMLLYLGVYIAIFPINLFQSSLRYLFRREHSWRSYSGVN
ncbi:MAG: glycosyltransferase family 2 protein [Candidatus Aenigmarchaeota archaeon]|nr:glycosyltransferase family 2 protein [Candidatus Aenigmarchaeota archaeon]